MTRGRRLKGQYSLSLSFELVCSWNIGSAINRTGRKNWLAISEYRPFSRLPLAIAALGYWPSNSISCIRMYSHWLQHSFPSSLSYWNHVSLCALAQPHTLFQIPSLLFLTINAYKLFGLLYNCNNWRGAFLFSFLSLFSFRFLFFLFFFFCKF